MRNLFCEIFQKMGVVVSLERSRECPDVESVD